MSIREQYLKVREFIKEKSINLMDHENKSHAKVSIGIGNYESFVANGKTYYIVPTNIFKAIIEQNLLQAQKNNPELFGTGNAIDVIKAIYNVEPWYELERFTEILMTEQFCYVVEMNDENLNEKILRFDLYRKLENKEANKEFIGGLFHAFKHFSIEGKNLSTSNEINNITTPKDLIHLIIEAFYSNELVEISENTFKVEALVNGRKYRFVFYFETNTKVYFLKSVYRI